MHQIPQLPPLDQTRSAIVRRAVDRREDQWRRDKVELAKMAREGRDYSRGAASLLDRQPEVFDRQLSEYNYRAERGWFE